MMVTVTQRGPQAEKPVTMVWSANADDVGVMLSVAQLLQHAKSNDPWAPVMEEITITF